MDTLHKEMEERGMKKNTDIQDSLLPQLGTVLDFTDDSFLPL